MSKPPPCNVQIPLLNNWLPTGEGYPMSAQFQPVGQAVGAGTAVFSVLTESKVALPKAFDICDVTTTPPSIGPLIFIVALEPSRGVQVTPSGETYVVKMLFQRATRRYAGAANALFWVIICAFNPWIVRYCTVRPEFGVTKTA